MNRIPMVVVVAHTMCVLLMATLIAGLRGEATMLWGLFMVFDFPASFLGGPIIDFVESSVRPFGFMAYDVCFHALFFMVFGGIQYFVISAGIVRLLRRRLTEESQSGPRAHPRGNE